MFVEACEAASPRHGFGRRSDRPRLEVELHVLPHMGISAKQNRVGERVIDLPAPATSVMGLKIFKRPTFPASPAIALQNSVRQPSV